MKRRILAWLAAVLISAGPAFSHDVWVDREEGGYTVRVGHRSGDDHGGPPPKTIRAGDGARASCHGASGESLTLEGIPAWPLFAGEECAAFTFLFSSGYWTKTASGTMNAPKNEVDGPLKSWLSFESVKRIDRWHGSFVEPLTTALEIVPLRDPLSLEPGEKLRLRIVLEKKPVEGAVILVDGKGRGESDAEGRVNVKIRKAGFQSIVASFRTPGDGATADEIVRTATLNFVTGEER